MATTIFTTGLNGDFHRITETNVSHHLDWNSDAKLYSGHGIINILVGIMEYDRAHDFLGIAPNSGVTLSDGLNPGSIITMGGSSGKIMSTSNNGAIGIQFWDDVTGQDRPATQEAVQIFLRALTYKNTQATLEDDFSRKIQIFISNKGGDSTRDFVTFTKWLPHQGGPTGGNDPNAGGNLPPSIGGNPSKITISDSAAPFAPFTVTDANGDNLTLSVGISDPNRGMFLATSLGGGTYNSATGTYTISGAPAQVQAALQNLVFVSKPSSESAPASFAPITFKILVSDLYRTVSTTLGADLWINRADVLKGTSRSDKLYGYGGKDKLSGGAGNDKLWGGSGNDTLKGDSGKDTFAFDTKVNTRTNKDKIADFKVTDDSIWLDNAVFTKLGRSGSENKPAQLKSSYFTIGDKAKDRNDYIIYNDKKGVLLYDADGSGRGKAVEIASLSKNLAMTHKDFFVV
ncbi:calcium-binding protein [Microvirga sp. CF3062]|uniref:calcium-binding protein n=1 Tax=Microvirga sp. CF3062 TaxID=3110182 RepID=UPI002E79585F|nr:calcium-binding protein [Microvirga sp. CF3062]MEE1655894.1 calcium-binding protein [Microvirga sp. CF3062]